VHVNRKTTFFFTSTTKTTVAAFALLLTIGLGFMSLQTAAPPPAAYAQNANGNTADCKSLLNITIT
jgi:hypothetical protein